MATTNYYVLAVEPEPGDVLQVVGEAESGSGEGAIRKVVAQNELNLQGRYVAVPIRNWTEIEFEVEERDPIVKANYISERRTRAPQPTPGQTTIEEEIAAEALASEIEGDSDVGFVNPDEGVEDPEAVTA